MRLTDQQGIELFPSLSPAGDYFAYTKRDGGDLDIFLQRIGGAQPINLTADSPVDDTEPAWSPDGRSIAFRSARNGGGLFLMGATGESVRRLVGFGYQPAWSPDGREIAFSTATVSDPFDRPKLGQIWRVAAAGGQPRLLVAEDAVQPSWSPDGSRIAYWSVDQGTGRRSLWTIASDGQGAVPLTNGTVVDWSPVWSPEGWIYFSSNRSGSMNLWRIAVDERTGEARGAPEPVAIPAQWAGFPRLSPDGRKMVYATREKTVNLERVRLDPDGPRVVGKPEPLTRGTSVFNYASVSPDGEWIVLSLLGEREDLMVVHRDGGALRRLMDDPFKDRVGVWGPDGRILFYSDRRGQYNAWSIEADGSGLRPLIATQPEPVFRPVPSPDGTSAAVCLGSVGAATIDLTRPLEARRQVRLPASPWGQFCADSWSRDGEKLVGIASGAVVSFSFRTGVYERLGPGKMPSWMADDERILFLDLESTLRTIDPRTRETRLLLRPPEGSFFENFAVSPDNRWLYLLRATEEGDIWMSY
jgi:Tol biopolymer transport system component